MRYLILVLCFLTLVGCTGRTPQESKSATQAAPTPELVNPNQPLGDLPYVYENPELKIVCVPRGKLLASVKQNSVVYIPDDHIVVAVFIPDKYLLELVDEQEKYKIDKVINDMGVLIAIAPEVDDL